MTDRLRTYRLLFSLFILVIVFCSQVRSQTLQLDNTFGSGGRLTVDFSVAGLRNSFGHRLFVQPSGRIVVNGSHQINGFGGPSGIATCGLTSSGTLDSGFGTSGRTLEMNEAFAWAIEPLSNGQYLRLVYLSGSFTGLNRLNADGSIDSSFVADLNIGDFVAPILVTTRSDGKIHVLVRGFGQDEPLWLFRLNANGSRDSTFGENGVTRLRNRYGLAIFGMKVLPDNRIVLGGYQSTSGGPQGGNVAWAALLDENGFYDRRFGLQGVMRLPFPHAVRVSKVLLQPDGKIVLVGNGRPEGTERLMLIRLTLRGRRDTSFGNGGVAFAPSMSPGSFELGHSGVLMSDGRVLVVGSYVPDQFSTSSSFVIARFGSSGTLEARTATPFTPDFNSVAADVAIQPDGKVVVAGYTRNPDATADGNLFAIARYIHQ